MNAEDHRKALETFYKYQSWTFKFFAVWKIPDGISQRLRLWHTVYFYYILGFWVLLFDSTLLIQVLQYITNLNEVIKVFFIFATALAVLAKFSTIKMKNGLYQHLVDSIHRPMFRPVNPREVKLFMASVHLSRNVRNSYCFISLCALNVVLLTQYIVDNSELPLSAYTPMSLDRKWCYVMVYLYQYFAVSLCCYMNIAFESISASFLIHVKGQLDILGDRLEHLGKSATGCDDESIHQQLKDCILFYTEILQLVKTIEELLSFPISIQICCSVLVLVANFYAMSFLSQPGDYVNFFKILIYQICMLSQIFILCFFSNEVTLKGAELSYSLYQSEWVPWNKRNRKLILLMMMHFDMPISIRSINRNYRFDLVAFTSIVNSSYSYFALLKRINS